MEPNEIIEPKITANCVGSPGFESQQCNVMIISKFFNVINELDSRLEKRKEISSEPEDITMELTQSVLPRKKDKAGEGRRRRGEESLKQNCKGIQKITDENLPNVETNTNLYIQGLGKT